MDELDEMLDIEAEMAAEAAAAAASSMAQEEFDPSMFEEADEQSSVPSSPSAAAAAHETSSESPTGGIMQEQQQQQQQQQQQRRRLVQADEDEEEDEFAERGYEGGEQEEEEGSKARKEEQEEQQPKAPAVNARARLLWERLGKEGTRRRRQERAEEMEALPGMDCDDWRDDAITSGPNLAGLRPAQQLAQQQQQQQQQQKRRRLHLSSAREDGQSSSSSKASAGDGGGGISGGLLRGGGAMQQLATAVLPVPRVGERAKRKGELLSRPPAGGGGCATVVTGSGDLLYLRKGGEGGMQHLTLAARRAMPNGESGKGTSSGKGVGLLSLPMADLKRKVERRRYARLAVQRLAVASSSSASKKEGEEEEEEEEGLDDGTPSKEKGKGPTTAASSSSPVVVSVAGKKQGQQRAEELWVHKYAPSAFPHLLSDEAVNREVLRLVRSWDEFVFKRALPKQLAEPTGTASTSAGGYKGNGKGKSWRDQRNGHSSSPNKKNEGKDATAVAVDPLAKRDRRPRVRAILLCGPPGMGKTTLAHVVANHCGYRPLEVNASDDRSAPVLREKITRAMQSQSVLGDKRPNCIILDEADGIDKAGIKLLVDVIKAPLASASKEKGASGGSKKTATGDDPSSSSSVPPLTRPIICVCNDLYAPQLRALREVAAVFRFRRTAASRLLTRLKTICASESLPLESTALGALAEATGHDVRACLNALQLFKARIPTLLLASAGPEGGSSRSAPVLQGAALSSRLSRELLAYIARGLKDQEKDLLQVCHAIFRRPSSLRPHSATAVANANARAQQAQERRDGTTTMMDDDDEHDELLGLGASTATTSSLIRVRDAETVMRAVSAFADHPQVLQALHENFPLLRYTDPTLAKTAQAAEWLAFSDLVQGRQMEAQHAITEDLHLATSAALHLLCRGETRPKSVQLPRRDYEHRMTKQSRQHILQAFQEGVLQNSGALWARQTSPVVLDVLSPLMEILNPALRAKNPDLYSASEKSTLRHLVQVMLGCGVSYVQTQQQQPHMPYGAFVPPPSQMQQQQFLHLEMVPALDQLVVFNTSTAGSNQGYPMVGKKTTTTTTHVLPSFVKLVATQEAKLEGMKQAEARKAELLRAKQRQQQQPHKAVSGATSSMPPAPSSSAKRTSSFSSSSAAVASLSKKPKLAPLPTGKPLPLDDDDDAALFNKGPRSWFQKLGTKRSTTGASAAAAAAAAAASAAATGGKEGGGKYGKENSKKGAESSMGAVVRFKYQAGYTNAIRRPVFLRDML